MTTEIVRELKLHGFAKGPKVLDRGEMLDVKEIIDGLFGDESIVDRLSANAPTVVNIAGKNPRLDMLLEKVVSHGEVKAVLAQVLGHGYKVWEVSARRSEIGDKGLALHQDAPGQLNLTLLLSDNLEGAGSTAFLSRSHKLPRWAGRISWSSVRMASPWLTALKGELGETGFFFNRTWHARLKNRSAREHDAIMIAFFPAGGSFVPFELDEDRLAGWSEWELGRLLDTSFGTRPLGNGRVQVVAAEGNGPDESYAMLLEKGEWDDADWRLKLLWLKLFSLEGVFRPLRLIYRVLKRLNGHHARKP